MKRLITLLTIVSVVSFGAMAQSETEGAVMTFDFEKHDFGDLNEGDDAQVDFVFTNTGDEDIMISNVKASCGCTTPFWSKEPVAPGEEGKITAKYNTNGKSGRFNKPITITYNNKTNPTTRIFIQGNVIPKGTNAGVPEKKPSIVNESN